MIPAVGRSRQAFASETAKSDVLYGYRRGKDLARRRTLRKKWSDYAWYRDLSRFHFDERHPELKWFPWIIVFSFVGVSAVAIGFNFGNPLAQVSGYLLGLVSVDFGMTAVAVLAWIMGKPLWREDADPRYLAVAIGFAGLPVWGVLQTLCFTFLIPQFSLSVACVAIPQLSWLPILWLVALPVSSILVDFNSFLRNHPDPAKGRLA